MDNYLKKFYKKPELCFTMHHSSMISLSWFLKVPSTDKVFCPNYKPLTVFNEKEWLSKEICAVMLTKCSFLHSMDWQKSYWLQNNGSVSGPTHVVSQHINCPSLF